jgi:hypothetical protein
MIKNIIEMVLKLYQKVWQLRKDNKILKTKIKSTSTAERLSVTSYGHKSSTRRDATSQVVLKNSALKTYKDALSVGCISLPRDPPVSDDFVLSATGRNESDGFTCFVTARNVNNAVVTAYDSFVTMVMKKRTEVRKEMPNTNRPFTIGVRHSSPLSSTLKKVTAKSVFIS